MKRILHLRASNFVGGPERQLLRHAQAQTNGAWGILLGTFLGPTEGHELLQRAKESNLQTISLGASGLKALVHETLQVIRSRQIDLVCTHGYKPDIVGILASRIARVPIACFLRGWTGESALVRAYEQMDRWALPFADRIVCLSRSQAEKVRAHPLLRSKIRIVCNAISAIPDDENSRSQARAELRRRLKLADNCKIIASAGRLSPEKGVSDFISAVAEISRQFTSATFVVFGDGVMRGALEEHARTVGVHDRLAFAGFHADLSSMLPGIDILVNPSHSEQMPNIVLEAMAAGIPVVATNVGAVAEIAGSDAAVRLVPPRTPEVLAQAIRNLLVSPDAASELGQAGRRRVLTAYSLAAQQRQFDALYEELLPSRANTSIAPTRSNTRNAAGAGGSQNRAPKQRPGVSVVIPVRNEEAHIRSVLTQIETQDYPHECIEVFVVDGNSDDRSRDVVNEFAKTSSVRVRLLLNPARLSSAGRNVGVAAASGDYIVFVDGHCSIPSDHLLRDTVRLFEETGAACLCRPQPLAHPLNDAFQEIVANVRATTLGHGRDSTIYELEKEGVVDPSSSGATYHRSVFEAVGRYDERFDACEDVEFNFRVFKAGLLSYFSPKLAVDYCPRRNLSSLWKQMMRYGRGRCRLMLKHHDAFSIAQLLPTLFALWITAGVPLSVISRPFRIVYLVLLLFYFATVAAFSLRLAWSRGWRHLVFAPAVYFTIHAGLGVGFLSELVASLASQRPQWRSIANANVAPRIAGGDRDAASE